MDDEPRRRRAPEQRRVPDGHRRPTRQSSDQPDAKPLTRQQKKAQEKQKQRKAVFSLIAIVGVILFVVVMIVLVVKDTQASAANTAAEAEKPVQETTPRNRQQPETVIHIRAAGDLNITNSVVQSGLTATGYDFTRAFQDVAPLLTEADCTVLNLEGNISGEPYGSETASAPAQILLALRNAGVDLVQSANSYSIYNGLIGLNSTLNAIRNAGLEPLGAYVSNAEFNSKKGYSIVEIQGIKVAFVAFTKGLGGMGLPMGSEKCVNILYEDYDEAYKKVNEQAITSILKAAASEKPDLTVAMLHWGSEGSDEITKTQNYIVSLMKKNGVDVILGSHPHLVHKVEFDKAEGTLIAYSLGDFYGNAAIGGSNYSIILDVEVTKDNNLGTTKVTGFSYTPIYTVTEKECDGYRRVVRIKEAMYAYDKNYVDRVTADCYSQMSYSLKRITSRIKGEETAAKKK